MKARDLMSPGSECVAAGDTLEQAARRLAELGVGAMPICGDDDRLIGMLSDRDIVVKAVAQGKDLATTFARELAEGKPVTIGADDSVGETLKTMAKARVRRLPVIDGRRLVGIVSQADIARRVSNRRSGRLLAAVSSRASVRRPRRVLGLALLLPLAAALYWSGKRSSPPRNSDTGSHDTKGREPAEARTVNPSPGWTVTSDPATPPSAPR